MLVAAAVAMSGANTASAATINVTTTADVVSADGQCSLREAINAAQAIGASSGCTPGEFTLDRILLPAGTFTLTGAANDNSNVSGDLDVAPLAAGELAISGAGAGATTVTSSGTDRLLDLPNFGAGIAVNLAVTDLTMRGGRAPAGTTAAVGGTGQSGGAILNAQNLELRNVALVDNRAGNGGPSTDAAFGGGQGGDGGAIAISGGSLTVTGSSLRSNAAGNPGAGSGIGGGSGGSGGAIASLFVPTGQPPAIRVISSTLSDNRAGNSSGGSTAAPGGGGAIRASGSLTVRNSTLSGNRAGTSSGPSLSPGPGGAILSSGGLAVRSSTISGNVATVSNAAPTFGAGGGIAISGGNRDDVAEISNSIVAGNSGGAVPDISTGERRAALEFVLIGDGTGARLEDIGGNKIGTAAAPIDPQLSALADNGGPTQTMALAATSPALDAGNSGGLFVDQRGGARPVDHLGVADATNGTGADIGAFELAAPPPSGPDPTPTPDPDPGPPIVDSTAPILELDGKSQVKAKPDKPTKKLTLTATADENCELVATGTIKIPQVENNGDAGKPEKFELTSSAGTLAATMSSKLKLKLDKKTKQALGDALSAGETSKAKILGVCADAAGNSGFDKLRVKVVPKG